jgi:hypothetical protein
MVFGVVDMLAPVPTCRVTADPAMGAFIMGVSPMALRRAVFLAALSALYTSAEAAEGADAWKALVGNTIVATTHGGGYTDYFGEDGTIRRRDQDGATSGHWSVEGDTVCLDFPDDDDRVCVHPRVDGAAGAFRDADGVEDAFTILPGNAKGL